LAGETEVNLPQRHFVHHKSHMTEPGPPDRLSYVVATAVYLNTKDINTDRIWRYVCLPRNWAGKGKSTLIIVSAPARFDPRSGHVGFVVD
jgi:hypothetical protein